MERDVNTCHHLNHKQRHFLRESLQMQHRFIPPLQPLPQISLTPERLQHRCTENLTALRSAGTTFLAELLSLENRFIEEAFLLRRDLWRQCRRKDNYETRAELRIKIKDKKRLIAQNSLNINALLEEQKIIAIILRSRPITQ